MFTNALERVVRMALERDHLHNLFFDQGASRGSRFMNGIVRALLALPPVQRAKANAQLRSRFVRYMIEKASPRRRDTVADTPA